MTEDLATAIAKLAPPEFSFKHLRINDLPMDDDANQAEPVKRLKSEITATRGPLFVTAEYNCTLPGVLKNAIDHASRPYGQSVWKDKPVRVVLAYLDMPTLGQPEAFNQAKEGLFDASGNFGPDSKAFMQGWMDRYVAWVKEQAA